VGNWVHQRWLMGRQESHYVAGLDGLETCGLPLRQQGGHVGLVQADRWRALAAGGAGGAAFRRRNVPRGEAILRACDHGTASRGDFAQAWHPHDQATAAALRTPGCHRLKPAGGAARLATLRALERRGQAHAAREGARAVRGYFANHVQRLDDPASPAKGGPIGAGPGESAGKPVVGQRRNGAGMRWREAGADTVGHFRGLFRSAVHQWDAFGHRNGPVHYLPRRRLPAVAVGGVRQEVWVEE
jgi:hypothetical protein